MYCTCTFCNTFLAQLECLVNRCMPLGLGVAGSEYAVWLDFFQLTLAYFCSSYYVIIWLCGWFVRTACAAANADSGSVVSCVRWTTIEHGQLSNHDAGKMCSVSFASVFIVICFIYRFCRFSLTFGFGECWMWVQIYKAVVTTSFPPSPLVPWI